MWHGYLRSTESIITFEGSCSTPVQGLPVVITDFREEHSTLYAAFPCHPALVGYSEFTPQIL